ncbi:hypothetical protein [Spiroplasma endosymbiont of Agriotes lineatus]|uniref:hypothetical protein n=1 Tax=Spiroplasma endosymbiont of Agriotes lineatus TaxID=3077930 RepID=UPI0030D32DFE
MENLAKMADFLAQMLYKVFDLIWSLEVPGTKIQLIFPLFLMLAVEFLMAIILGFGIGSQQVNLERERRYAVKNSGRLSAWGKVKKHHQEISARINKQDKQVGNFHHKKSGQITTVTVRQNKNFKSWNQKSK